MTIDAAIKCCESMAEEQSRLYSLCPCPCDGTQDCICLKNGKDVGCTKSALEYRQLAEWLRDLKEARRLLKLSLEQNNPKCKYCIHDLEEEQPGYNPCCTGETANCKWIHADEAEKLLKEEEP